MKIVMMVLAMLCFMTTGAQEIEKKGQEGAKGMIEGRANLTPEQEAELITKKLTLDLDLNEGQQKEVQKLELERINSRLAKKGDKGKKKELTDTEKFDRASSRLDRQIAHKNSMKRILNKEQFEKWENGRKHRGHKARKSRKKGSHPKKRH